MVAPNVPASASASASASAPESPSTTVSAAKLAANRANAQKSTGPRTEAGKAASRLNALKHGLRAELCVLPGEDAAEFAEFVDAAVRDLRPRGALQASYAREVAVQTWRLRRVPLAEQLLFRRHDPEPEDYDDARAEDVADYGRLMTADPAELSLDDCKRLEGITRRLIRAGRAALVRADNAAGAGYPADDPAYAADVLAAMLRARSMTDHAPNSVVWHCQRYEANILRARSTALRELLKLQQAHGAAQEGEEVWPGEQVRVGYPDVPEVGYEDEDEGEGDDDEAEEEGGGNAEGEEEAEAPPNEATAAPDGSTPAPAPAPAPSGNQAIAAVPAAPCRDGNVPEGAERTQTGPAPETQQGVGSPDRRRAGR